MPALFSLTTPTMGLRLDWTEAEFDAALREGWYLDLEDHVITATNDSDDDNAPMMFANDAMAFDHIRSRATEGSVLHIKAMVFDALATAEAWESRLPDVMNATLDAELSEARAIIAEIPAGEDRDAAVSEMLDKMNRRGVISDSAHKTLSKLLGVQP